MINVFIANLLRFIFLVIIQALIIQNVELGRYINPYLYVLFILMLPFETPDWLTMILSLLMGLCIDMFYNTMGMHAAASVFMAFCREGILKLFSPREGYETGVKPTIHHLGTPWFLSYAGTLILLHHTVLFFIEVFRFSEFFNTILRVILSSLFTLILVVLSQFLFYRSKEK